MEEILFDETAHRYYDNTDKKYTSVTTLIGLYTNTYDVEFWAMYTALKEHGYRVKPEPEKRSIYCNNVLYPLNKLMLDNIHKHWYAEVRARWDALTAEACLRGNLTHNALEDGINMSKGDMTGKSNTLITSTGSRTISTQHDLDNTKLKDTHPLAYQRLSGYIERGFSIFAEKRVHLPEFGVAGMIDVPLFIKNYFAILDWKTNKNELHKTAGYYKKIQVEGRWIKSNIWVETGERFKYPLDMLEASKFNIYALQLSLYSRILEYWGYKPLDNHLEIIHFPLLEEPLLIKIPYLRDEVDIMLAHFKQSQLTLN